MPNNKDNQKSDSQGSAMSGSSDRELESQGKDKSSGMGGESGQTCSSTSNKGPGPKSEMDDDQLKTAGGRRGNFSDKNRGSEDQWSPGSTGASDQ